jgi:hypothetical protein
MHDIEDVGKERKVYDPELDFDVSDSLGHVCWATVQFVRYRRWSSLIFGAVYCWSVSTSSSQRTQELTMVCKPEGGQPVEVVDDGVDIGFNRRPLARRYGQFSNFVYASRGYAEFLRQCGDGLADSPMGYAAPPCCLLAGARAVHDALASGTSSQRAGPDVYEASRGGTLLV